MRQGLLQLSQKYAIGRHSVLRRMSQLMADFVAEVADEGRKSPKRLLNEGVEAFVAARSVGAAALTHCY